LTANKKINPCEILVEFCPLVDTFLVLVSAPPNSILPGLVTKIQELNRSSDPKEHEEMLMRSPTQKMRSQTRAFM
jgi:hypothetical protein